MESPCLFTRQQALKTGYFYLLQELVMGKGALIWTSGCDICR